MQILTVVVGIIFVLLLLSLLATTLMELINSFFSLRGKNLIKALRNMLASDDEHEAILTEFQQNSLYRHLTQQYGRKVSGPPSYISAETFQSILFDVILKGDDYEQIVDRIDQLPDADLKNVLQQLWKESGGQIDIFRLEVQNWYNNVMDRASGWYKRNTQKILVLMGLGIAVLFNADTVSMYERLSQDEDLREEVYESAEALVNRQESVANQNSTYYPQGYQQSSNNNNSPSFDYSPTPPIDTVIGGRTFRLLAPEQATTTTLRESASLEEVQAYQEATLAELRNIRSELDEVSSPLGLGWEDVNIQEMDFYTLFTKLLGFILTALAVSLGAPFWFDLLRKLVNIRSSGVKP